MVTARSLVHLQIGIHRNAWGHLRLHVRINVHFYYVRITRIYMLLHVHYMHVHDHGRNPHIITISSCEAICHKQNI